MAGCKPEDFDGAMEDMRKSASDAIERVVNYDYSAFWQSLSSAVKTARRDRYLERQSLTMEVPKETQLAAYTAILNECSAQGCEVVERGYARNTIYPGNDSALIRFSLPSKDAPDFVNSILKHGAVTRNLLSIDDYIAKDAAYYENELAALRELKARLAPEADKGNTYSLDQVRDLQELLAGLGEKIMYAESDMAYLNRVKDRRLVEISIVRESNSASARIKSNLQNALAASSDYLHWAIILLLLVLIWKVVRLSQRMAKDALAASRRRREERRARKSVRDMASEPKLTPKL